MSNNIKANEPVTVDSLLKLAHTIDLFEQYTRPHASQLARFAEALALRIGLFGTDLNSLKIAALMHDIGEMIMDSPVLRTRGQVDFRARIDLWRHPIIGEQQLAKRELPKQAQLLVRWHHEWWNGSGYPDMLAAEAIPIGARILRLVDTYDALTAHRPYRQAFSEQEAQKIIARSAGIEFDPTLVKVFLEMLSEMAASSSVKESHFEPLHTVEPNLQPNFQPNLEENLQPNLEEKTEFISNNSDPSSNLINQNLDEKINEPIQALSDAVINIETPIVESSINKEQNSNENFIEENNLVKVSEETKQTQELEETKQTQEFEEVKVSESSQASQASEVFQPFESSQASGNLESSEVEYSARTQPLFSPSVSEDVEQLNTSLLSMPNNLEVIETSDNTNEISPAKEQTIETENKNHAENKSE